MRPAAIFLLSLLSPLLASATPDLVTEINAIRERGCDGHPGGARALRREAQLDRAAEALDSGRSLQDAMADAGYRATQTATMEISGSDENIIRALARKGCSDIVDPGYRAVGITVRDGRAVIILAAPFDPPAIGEATAVGRRVLELANEARARSRRCGWKRFDAAPPLAASEPLHRAALTHARDMAGRGMLTHAGQDGSTPGARATRAGYRWRVVGENIAAGQSTPEQVVADWLKSAHHCANLMDADFAEMGVAYALKAQDDKGIYWAQVFGAPRRN